MSIAPTDRTTAESIVTLGELLYANPAIALVSEKQWLSLVRAIGAGDQAAMRVLYEKAFPVLFTYLMRLTGSRQLTDALVLDVFEQVWCEAPVFDTTDGPVLGWIMRQARSLAIKRVGAGELSDSDSGQAVAMSTDVVLLGGGSHRPPTNLALERALETLTTDERQAIEATFLDGLSYAEFATHCAEPIGTIQGRIRSGWVKLQDALHTPPEET